MQVSTRCIQLKMKRGISLALRLLVTMAILAVVFRSVNLGHVVSHLLGIELLTIGLLLFFFLLENLAKVFNWRQLLKSMLDTPVRFVRVLCANLAGGFLGTVVPSSAGTDAVRVFYSRRLLGGHVGSHAASIVALNLLNWSSGAVMGLAVLTWLTLRGGYGLSGPILSLFVLLSGVALAFPGMYMLLRYRRHWLVWGLRRIPKRGHRVRRGVRKFVTALRVFERAHVSFPNVALVSTGCVLFQGLAWCAVGSSTGSDVPMALWLLMVPVSGIANVVPLSFIGLGFNQAVHFSVLAIFGVPAAEAVAVSTVMVLGSTLYAVSLGSIAFAASSRLRLVDSTA